MFMIILVLNTRKFRTEKIIHICQVKAYYVNLLLHSNSKMPKIHGSHNNVNKT